MLTPEENKWLMQQLTDCTIEIKPVQHPMIDVDTKEEFISPVMICIKQVGIQGQRSFEDAVRAAIKVDRMFNSRGDYIGD